MKMALALLVLNASFAIVNGVPAWDDATGPEGENLSDISKPEITVGIPGIGDVSIGNSWTVPIVLTAVVTGGMAGIASRVTTPQVVGILAFAGVFGWAFSNFVGILQAMQMPEELIAFLTGVHFFVMIVAIVQMSTGQSGEASW